MLADLFHADNPQHPTGTATIGSSEAILLGGLALKRRWQDRRRKEGKPTDKPNIVMGSEIHVRLCASCFLRFCCLWLHPRHARADAVCLCRLSMPSQCQPIRHRPNLFRERTCWRCHMQVCWEKLTK